MDAIQEKRQAAIQSVEELAAEGIRSEQALRTVAYSLGVKGADTVELATLIERVLERLREIKKRP